MFRRKGIKNKAIYKNFTKFKAEVSSTKSLLDKAEKRGICPELQHIKLSFDSYEDFVVNGNQLLLSWREGELSFYDVQALDDASVRASENLANLRGSLLFSTALVH